MVPSLLNSTESFSESVEKLGTTNYFIPVWNSVKLLQDVIRVEYNISDALITFAVNIAAAAVGVLVVGRLFNKEKIVNG